MNMDALDCDKTSWKLGFGNHKAYIDRLGNEEFWWEQGA